MRPLPYCGVEKKFAWVHSTKREGGERQKFIWNQTTTELSNESNNPVAA